MEMEKYLELILFNVVGGTTGFLAGREQRRRAQLEETARGLEESYAKLQEQSERIIAIEEQLRRAERLSLMGELSAVLAHEIRNPLGSIRGTAEILKDDFTPGDRKYEFVEILVKETERLNRVVEDFLRQARPQPGVRERFDLSEELRMVATLVAAEAKRRGIALEFGIAPAELMGDREQLRQVVLNLLLNALHATPSGGTVTIAVSTSGSVIELRVSDTGAGIPAADLQRIFEPFFTTKEGGTGLGLAVTKRIIAAHGGTIAFQSEEGRGTVVTLRLPAGHTEGNA
jgi:signal transduction histidine kinase